LQQELWLETPNPGHSAPLRYWLRSGALPPYVRVIVRDAHRFLELARSYRDQLVEHPVAAFTRYLKW